MQAPLRAAGTTRTARPVAPALGDEVPTLHYDLSVVAHRLAAFEHAFDGRVGVRYAVKCNPDRRVLQTVLDAGGGFEVASLGELHEVLAVGGDPATTLYSNPVKPPSHVRAAFVAGVRRFAVDSREELHKVAAQAPGSEVYARVRVDDSSSRFPLSSKFGCTHELAQSLLLEAVELGLLPAGLTFHVGSQCTDADAWAHALRLCAPLMERLLERGIRLGLLDLGGGFPADYGVRGVPSLDDIGERVLSALDHLPYVPADVLCEPGRAVVAEAGTLVTTVIGRTERNGRHWVFVDVGAYNGLMEAAQTGGRMEFPLSTSVDAPGPTMRCTVTGPSCDSSDTLFQDVALPEDLQVGDRLLIGSAGAYSTCYAAPFNGFPVPVAVYSPAPGARRRTGRAPARSASRGRTAG